MPLFKSNLLAITHHFPPDVIVDTSKKSLMQSYITMKNVQFSPKNQTFTGFLRIVKIAEQSSTFLYKHYVTIHTWVLLRNIEAFRVLASPFHYSNSVLLLLKRLSQTDLFPNASTTESLLALVCPKIECTYFYVKSILTFLGALFLRQINF